MEATEVEGEVCMLGLEISIWSQPCITFIILINIFFHFPVFCALHTFSLTFAFFLVAGICSRKCHSMALLSCESFGGWPYEGRGTPKQCFTTRPWASTGLNFSKSVLLFGSDQYLTIALCIATPNSSLNKFVYHFAPFFHSSKYGHSIWSYISTLNMLTL
jgi:hypothetical protein